MKYSINIMFISSVLLLLAVYFNASLCTRKKKKSARSQVPIILCTSCQNLRENCMSETKPGQNKTKIVTTNFIWGDITVAFTKTRSKAKLIGYLSAFWKTWSYLQFCCNSIWWLWTSHFPLSIGFLTDRLQTLSCVEIHRWKKYYYNINIFLPGPYFSHVQKVPWCQLTD